MHLWETASRPVPSPAEPACNDSTPRYLTARIVAHRQIAAATFRIRLDCPEIAHQALPGQFAMLRIPDRLDPLLARPLAVYDSFSAPEGDAVQGPPNQRRYIDFVYVVHGKFTTALKEIPPGEHLIVWGPLGNGFVAIPPVEHLVLVAGGIGQTALLALGKEQCGRASYGLPSRSRPTSRVTLCWGARTAAAFGDAADFSQAGIDVHLATLDGSAGQQGTVIDLLNTLATSWNPSESLHVACCGPEGMMEAVARWTAERRIGCHVSLEAPMACGIGICFTCVARIRETPASGDSPDAPPAWDYRRTCVEGPIFNAEAIEW